MTDADTHTLAHQILSPERPRVSDRRRGAPWSANSASKFPYSLERKGGAAVRLHPLVGRSVIPVSSHRLTVRIKAELKCNRQEESGNRMPDRPANASIFRSPQRLVVPPRPNVRLSAPSFMIHDPRRSHGRYPLGRGLLFDCTRASFFL